MNEQNSYKPTLVTLMAPLSGVLMPIEAVPDPVFAQKLVGDGISLDPTTQTLLAPCAGEVIQLHSAGHALTLRTAGDLEVMMHIGLDTVNLKGAGFTTLVKVGDAVLSGAPLIEFAADEVARGALSLLTQIVLITPERVKAIHKHAGIVLAGKDPILTVELAEIKAGAAAVETAAPLISRAVIITNPSGLHARPAATLAGLARGYRCDLHLRKGEEQANARSVSSIMALDIRHGDKVFLIAGGPDAREALDALLPRLEAGLGEAAGEAQVSAAPGATTAPSGDPDLLTGISTSPGLAAGKAFIVARAEIQVPEHGGKPEQERHKLEDALASARLQLDAIHSRVKASGNPEKADIFGAHLELLEDPDLLDLAESAIAKGKSAAFSWKGAFTAHADRLAGLSNKLLAERANDIKDVGRRVLERLLGMAEGDIAGIPDESILIAEELTPSDVISLDLKKVKGCGTIGGGATSHVAILARSLGLPLVVGLEPRALEIARGTPLILDGGKGIVRLNPSKLEMEKIRGRLARMETRRAEEAKFADRPAVTLDGHKVKVFANIGNMQEAKEAVKLGAEGVGLLRSEFLFLDRTEAPTEDEQTQAYRTAAEALGKQRPLIIRTLDVGGDKHLSYLQIPKEDNPFLGERGIRVCLNRPELLRTQVRAILRAGRSGPVQIMFPMITDIGEYRAARAIVKQEMENLGAAQVPVGVMIEVPAAAVLAAGFASEVDFLSIGTNDLTQYTLAMDRGHPGLAAKADALHPSVLKLISGVVEAAHAGKKPIGVCGGLAGDQKGIPLLVGLGVDELSVSVSEVPAVKAAVRRLKLEDCRRLAKQALTLGTAAEVRALFSPETEE
ncbi:MAG: phosphoenolpyruvate--protein phosphotransferase [Elusimicrobiota bacterium]